MITKSDIVPLLLETCPRFRGLLQELRDYYAGEEPGVFIEVGEFARFVVQSRERGETSQFVDIFALIERMLEAGDPDTQVVVTLGILEDIQVLSTHYAFGPVAFHQWLGPASRRAWDRIDATWRESGGSLARVIRAEVQTSGKGKSIDE